MAQQVTDTAYPADEGITAKQALDRARAAQIETYRRWPVVRSITSALQEIRATGPADPPTPKARTA